jgi:alkylhydroperoxidase/carboxymuconolactone decarboxylase family protein YurZ
MTAPGNTTDDPDAPEGPLGSVQTQHLVRMQEQIQKIRAGRGYVLPSHAMLAAAGSDLLDKYEQVYRSITYTFAALSPFEKNFVWLVVIGCVQTPTGAHHLQDFIDADGSLEQAETATSLAMIAIGSGLLDVVAPGWQKVLPDFSPRQAYQNAIDRVARDRGLALGLVHMALAAGLACRGAFDKVALHIRAAKQAGVTDDALAEALTVVILPAGNPAFVQASSVWQELIRSGEVEASPAYRYASNAI